MKLGAGAADHQDAILEVRGVSKVFGSGAGEVRAVDGVDLAVHRGEIVLIMGPSGSGKTTLLTIIGGLLRPSSGSVHVHGREISSMKESALPDMRRRLVGFVFQNFNLLESLTSRENVEIALNFAGQRGREAAARARALLEMFGLGHRINFMPRDLSGGEKQRLSIARALANDPELVLADEPTANLDSKHGHEVVVALRDVAKKQGRTVVIVSHDYRILEVADRVLWLEDGRLKDVDRDASRGYSLHLDMARRADQLGRFLSG